MSRDSIGVGEAARIIGVHENTIRNWVKDGKLQSTQVGRYNRFSRRQIERLALTLPEPPPIDRWLEAYEHAQKVVREQQEAVDGGDDSGEHVGLVRHRRAVLTGMTAILAIFESLLPSERKQG
jgi:excisionase family DNA binding protein